MFGSDVSIYIYLYVGFALVVGKFVHLHFQLFLHSKQLGGGGGGSFKTYFHCDNFNIKITNTLQNKLWSLQLAQGSYKAPSQTPTSGLHHIT